MKGDFSRKTFDPKKHYRRVLMQQGRVQLDADWNEQQEMVQYLLGTGIRDIVGLTGAPRDNAGFAISALTNDLKIGKGRMYVDGVLCELENDVTYLTQPDYPDAPALAAGTYLAYLDAWERHITALDDPLIRERALNGADTATRSKLVAQVKLLQLSSPPGNLNCQSDLPGWGSLTAPRTARLTARLNPVQASSNFCDPAPATGYSRLENQLYRVEVHQVNGSGKLTLKWSRDNGSVLVNISQFAGDAVKVDSLGPDGDRGFLKGKWAEVIDDWTELACPNAAGAAGQLLQVATPDPSNMTVNFNGPVTVVPASRNPRLRLWDGVITDVAPSGSAWLDLESGIQVQLSSSDSHHGDFGPGDYWLIPARNASGELEWPPYAVPNNNPTGLPPAGVYHHYCRLALIQRDAGTTTSLRDCRRIFPPLTELVSFFYVGGDGQEAMPETPTLVQPLQVGVANGQIPVAGASVRFDLVPLTGNAGRLAETAVGAISGAGQVTAVTGADGLAACHWRLDPNPAAVSQRVKATLLDCAGNAVHLPVFFNANLSLARQVSYDPDNHAGLQGKVTVQDAIDALYGLGSSGYTVILGPDTSTSNWQRILDGLPQGASIRFREGEYHLQDKLSLSKNKRLILTGAGAGTRIIADSAESAIQFTDCESVIVRDLYVGSGVPGPGAGIRLNGALSFTRCADVTVECVTANCVGGSRTGATCITVLNDVPARPCSVRVLHCGLQVGQSQVGILVVNPHRVQIEDNLLQVSATGQKSEKKAWVDRNQAGLERLLASDFIVMPLAKPTETPAQHAAEPAVRTSAAPARSAVEARALSEARQDFTIGDKFSLSFVTAPALQGHWGALVRQVKATSTKAVMAAMKEMVHELVAQPPAYVAAWIDTLYNAAVPVAAQGIVVAGQQADDVRILANTIEGFRQGIRVAVSHAGQGRGVGAADYTGRVSVADNRVLVQYSTEDMSSLHYGIFVGNCRSLQVRSNYAELQIPNGAEGYGRCAGIRVFGHMGSQESEVTVADNHIPGFVCAGVRFVPLFPRPEKRLWLFTGNYAPDAGEAILTAAPVTCANNVP